MAHEARPDATWANVGDARTTRSGIGTAHAALATPQNPLKTCKSQHNSLDEAPAREVTVLSLRRDGRGAAARTTVLREARHVLEENHQNEGPGRIRQESR